jgi:hypothetical protein
MQKTWKAIIVAAALTGALVYPFTFAQAQEPAAPPAATQPAPAPGPAPAPAPVLGRHPEIYRAIADLKKVRYHLQHAAHDFGGHRAAALAATNEAIKQLQIAQQYDKD